MKSANYLHNIVESIEKSPKFLHYAIVKKSEIEKNIDYIYASLPVEVQEARAQNKDFTISKNIYDLLGTLEISLEKSFLLLYNYFIINTKEIGDTITQIADNLPNY